MQERRKSEIAVRFHAAAIHLLRTVRKRDPVMGLSPARASVLSMLVFGGPLTLKQLTKAEQVAAPTMTKLVAGLERDGYVRREPDKQDGRSWVIHATPRARKLLQRGRQERVKLLAELLGGASAAEWRILDEACDIVERSLRR